jgi:hypothetical protein
MLFVEACEGAASRYVTLAAFCSENSPRSGRTQFVRYSNLRELFKNNLSAAGLIALALILSQEGKRNWIEN